MTNGYNPGTKEDMMEALGNGGFIPECIITDKVYSACQQRVCFPDIEKEIPDDCEVVDVEFEPGMIVPGTLSVQEIEGRPNFRRVRFELRIPFRIICDNGEVIEGNLPDIEKDVVLFIPESRDEFDFRIVVETSSQLLDDPEETNGSVIFPVGVFIIIKVVGRVQLLIPAFGFCPPPPECEEFRPEDEVCVNFDDLDFPDFFPPQYDDIDWP